MAAMFWKVRTGRIYFSLPAALKSRIVSGTKMIRETSLVTIMEVKKTPKTRNRVRVVIRFIRAARQIRGRKMFSFLNPSRTHSIISSVPSVRQSISPSSRAEGGVMIIAATAASKDRVNIISRFKNPKIFFINPLPSLSCPALPDRPRRDRKRIYHQSALLTSLFFRFFPWDSTAAADTGVLPYEIVR